MGRRVLAAVVLAAWTWTPGAAAEDFYRWKDEQGVTHYTSTPPPAGRGGSAVVVDPDRGVTSFAPAPAEGEPEPAAAPARTRRASKSVVMYSTARCPYCKAAREYFRSRSIAFNEYDVETSEKGRADYRALGGKGVPLILVGEERVHGFSAARLDRMLK